MDILCFGLNHETASVAVRERLAFTEESLASSLQWLKELPGIREAFILSTCNRVEFYFVADEPSQGEEALRRLLRDRFGLDPAECERYLYRYGTGEAVAHLFRVTSGMDSMVIGEPQIAGQVKDAYRHAIEQETAAAIFNRLLHRSLFVSKRVRTETELASRAVSVSYVAVELAKKIFGELRDRTVLLLGAGEMAELAARHLTAQGIGEMLVASRTLEHACKLAAEMGGRALPMGALDEHLPRVDILICSTAAPQYVLDARRVREALRGRKHKPMFLIDIAVPRNIDPQVNEIENVYVYDMDDLQNVLRANMEERKRELKRAEAIVQEEVRQFRVWLNTLGLVPTIVALKAHADQIRRQELQEAFSILKSPLSQELRAVMEGMSEAIVNKILHDPITELKKAEKLGEAGPLADALRRLFSLKADRGHS
ncbi:MAG: glutamyl-tRNA reductase [bacterium]